MLESGRLIVIVFITIMKITVGIVRILFHSAYGQEKSRLMNQEVIRLRNGIGIVMQSGHLPGRQLNHLKLI